MNEEFMKERPVLPLLLSMALPMILSMLVNSLYNIVDSFFVAKISEDAMTALSLALSDPEFCKCGSHRFWSWNQCGDRVLSRRKGARQGKCSSVKGYASFCCSWRDHDGSLYSDHAGISADVHIE